MLASGMRGIVFWEWLSTQESFIRSFSDAVAINAGLEDLQTSINPITRSPFNSTRFLHVFSAKWRNGSKSFLACSIPNLELDVLSFDIHLEERPIAHTFCWEDSKWTKVNSNGVQIAGRIPPKKKRITVRFFKEKCPWHLSRLPRLPLLPPASHQGVAYPSFLASWGPAHIDVQTPPV